MARPARQVSARPSAVRSPLIGRARDQGDAFDLQEFHDCLWREGNVPLSLQRWELLGRRDQLDTADRLGTEDE